MRRFGPLLLAVALPGCALNSSAIAPTPTPVVIRPAASPTAVATAAPSPASTAQAAPIIVTAPRSGDLVASPIRVSGTASVFEGTVQIRVKDAGGRVIGQLVTTAAQGAPGRGAYSADVPVSGSGAATVEVFSSSARDGSEQFLVRVPVTLR
jgi:hypothetical protein